MCQSKPQRGAFLTTGTLQDLQKRKTAGTHFKKAVWEVCKLIFRPSARRGEGGVYLWEVRLGRVFSVVRCLRLVLCGLGYRPLWKQDSYAQRTREAFLPPQAQASLQCQQKPWPPHSFKDVIHYSKHWAPYKMYSRPLWGTS